MINSRFTFNLVNAINQENFGVMQRLATQELVKLNLNLQLPGLVLVFLA